MFYFDIKNLDTNLAQNFAISKKIEIDKDLDCFIIIDSSNQKILSPILNKIMDLIIDNVSTKDAYSKFSITLESINFFIKNLKNKENDLEEINIIIAILDKGNLHFSKIGSSTCYLINIENEFIEISDKKNETNIFDFISSGKILSGNKIILSNTNLLEIITKSDISEISKITTPEEINKNIIHILNEEKFDKKSILITIKYDDELEEKQENKYIEKCKNIFLKSLDNNFSKKIYALYLLLVEEIQKRGKILKNILFFSGIIVSSLLLYYSISSIVGETIQTNKNTEYKNELIKARDYIRLATENIKNTDVFELNIKKAEELISTVEKEKLFLTDIESIKGDLSIIKKEFNGIEIFESSLNNLIFRVEFKDPVKILENNKKIFVIAKNSVYGPILSGKDVKNMYFENLEVDDEFLDGTVVGDDLIIVTKKSRLVKLTKDGKFSYIAVIGQDTWQNSSFIDSFNSNIYLTNKDKNQIYKHSPSLGSYTSGVPYLKDDDSKSIGKILSIGIDGGIYLLKNDLSVLKLFTSPKYRLESIVLNKLPKNYTLENGIPQIIVKQNLNYFYMYLNNKIWIFEPNTKNVKDTKSLQYIGQIEGKNEIIKGVYIVRDGELNVLTNNGIYKIIFEVSKEGKLIIR